MAGQRPDAGGTHDTADMRTSTVHDRLHVARLHTWLACTAMLGAGVPAPAPAALPAFDHVLIVVMENHSYVQVVGSASAPYITALAAQGANFTESYAIEHPSEPNYLDLFSGSNQGVTDDSCPHTFAADNLASQLLAAEFSFVGYSEGLPEAGSTVCSAGDAPNTYKRKHNPWVNFSNVPAASNQPLTALPADYADLPTLSFVIPNQCHDMHDCPVATGDAWLAANIDAYAQWAKTHASLLVLTWDENDYSEGNQIATIFVGAMVVPGDYAAPIDHYSVLATLEALYGLPAIGGAADRTAITDIWDTRLFADGFEP